MQQIHQKDEKDSKTEISSISFIVPTNIFSKLIENKTIWTIVIENAMKISLLCVCL